jgi:hypothetical protein
MSWKRLSRREAEAGSPKRKAWLLALALPALTVVPIVTLPAAIASADGTAGPDCSLNTTNIGIQDDMGMTMPGSVTLNVSDTTGLNFQKSPYHLNSTWNHLHVLGGVTSSSSTFTQTNEVLPSSASLQVTNDTSGAPATVCLAQFKNTTGGWRALSTGFAFPSDRNLLYIQNSAFTPLSSIEIVINGDPWTFSIPAGALLSFNMAAMPNPFGTGTFDPLHPDTPGTGSDGLNQLTVSGVAPTPNGDGGDAEVVVFGVGPFVYQPLPE